MSNVIAFTGASGFVGSHLLGAIRTSDRFRAAPAPSKLDVRDDGAMSEWLASIAPCAIVHLAAQSNVADAFRDPRATLDVNLLGTLTLLQSIKRAAPGARLLFVSSGDVYGKVDDDELPLAESRSAEPRNPYAVSKLAAELLCRQWHFTEGLDVVIARPFNHIGPGQDERFVVASLARQVADIAMQRRHGPVDAGDVDVTRDFTDVRDVVRSYLLMIERGVAGRIYNVGSGRETCVRDVFELLCRLGGVRPSLAQDPQRMRRAEQRRMAASSALLHADTGWRPEVGLERSLTDILEYWKARTEP